MTGNRALPVTSPVHELDKLDTYLRQKKAAIIDEIRRYPPPIPACDAQFNHLTAQRSQLTVVLNRLHALTVTSPTADDATVDAFFRAVDGLHADTRTAVHAIIRQADLCGDS